MRKKEIRINIDSIQDYTTALTKKSNEFSSLSPKTMNNPCNGIRVLLDNGFSTRAFKKYDKNVDTISTYMMDYCKRIDSYLEEMKEIDNQVIDAMPGNSKK
jgi:hypothetical protein